MEKELKKFFQENLDYTPFPETDSIEKVYNLFINNILFEPQTPTECIYLGDYYWKQVTFLYCEREKMLEYYLMAIDKGNIRAMNDLGWFYWRSEYVDYPLAIKYFKMAIKIGNYETSLS